MHAVTFDEFASPEVLAGRYWLEPVPTGGGSTIGGRGAAELNARRLRNRRNTLPGVHGTDKCKDRRAEVPRTSLPEERSCAMRGMR